MEQSRGIFEALNGNIYGNISNSQTLVLGHGFGSTQSVWHNLIPFLALYFRVVVFDLAFSPNVIPKMYDPNKYSNYSGYAHDLVGVLDELKVDKAIFMGHSMSSMIGCLASLQRPQLFQHLILLGGSPRYLSDQEYEGGFEKSDIDEIFNQMKQNYTNWVQNFAPNTIGVNNSNAISEFEHSLKMMNPNTSLDVAKSVFLSDYRSILPQVQVRATIIQSKDDFVVPLFVGNYMKEKLGGLVNLTILDTHGHFPMLTNHSLLLNALSSVLGI
ncbi:unnamed protein product [Amaranthus hypochondriacus]